MFTISLSANKVEIEIAKTVAINHYVLQYEQIKGTIIEAPSVLETFILEKENDPVIYIFNFEDGFTLISANDAVIPILGFSIEGKYIEENRPPALIDLIEHYKDQIDYAIKNVAKGSDETLYLWSFYSNPDNLKDSDCEIWPKHFIVYPLLTTRWDQTCYYNAKCPYDVQSAPEYCNHVPNGCVALAMAQVMKYWNYPENGSGTHGYNDGATYPEAYGYQYANFGATTYDWVDMPDVLTGGGAISSSKSSQNQIDAVSTLIYHCGVSVDMDYGYDGSAAFTSTTRNGLVNYFNYNSSANYNEKVNYTNSEWESILRSDINYHQPIIYRGSSSQGAHAFVLDGYTKLQTEWLTYYAVFHINWGWGGTNNGYFYLSDLTPGNHNYNYYQAAVVDITPPNLVYPPPPQPSYISEPACYPHCRDVEVEYFVPTVYEATSYEWDITGITAAAVTWNGRYATVWSHHDGTATLWCRALNHGVPGPWQTTPICIENCNKSSGPIINEDSGNMSNESLINIETNDLHGIVQIYPNPANNILNISLPPSFNFTIVELINNQGEVVKSINLGNNFILINIDDVPPGLYVLKLSSSNSKLLEKVIILK